MNSLTRLKGFRSFTLIEAIFLIVIVVILASVLFPALNSVRQGGYRTTCETNLLRLGMVLSAYADDHGIYPPDGPLVDKLVETGYLKDSQNLFCPLDDSELRDTYSMGYLGGHPLSIDLDDPLIVCGWHPRIGTLAVYSDGFVMPLKEKQTGEEESYPIKITHDGDEVGPGFTLAKDTALAIESEDGNEVLLYGENGAYFISASYNPIANDGNGEFTIAVSYDFVGTAKKTKKGKEAKMENQKVKSDSIVPVEFQSTLKYCRVKLRSDPDASKDTEIKWTPEAVDSTALELKNYLNYKLTHIYTGQLENRETSGSKSKYYPSPKST